MRRLLEDEQLKNIYADVVDILENIGISFDTEKALTLFKENGARVDGKKVFIPHTMLEKALDLLPKHDYSDLSEKRVAATSPFGMVPLLLDEETGEYRKTTIDDAVKMYQLTQTSDFYECASPSVIEPQGNDAEDQYVAQIAMLLKYSDKWFSNGIRATARNSKNGDLYNSSKEAIQLVKKFHDNFEEPVMSQCICPMSPLAYDWECLDNLTAAVEEGQTVVICPCTLTNLTGPASLMGLVIHDIAISLAGIVYIQLLSPGLAVDLCCCSGVTDMRSIQPAYGTAEYVYIAMMFYECCKDLKINCTICGSLADSAKVDYQSGVESLMTTMMPYMVSEIDTIWCYPGLMSAWYCGSFEKLILDEEMMRGVNRALKGVNTKIDPKLKKSLIAAQETGTFLSGKTPSTYKKDHYLTKIFTKYGVSQDISLEKTEVHLKVKKELESRVEMYKAPDLTETQKKLLQDYLPTPCKF
ncbi:MAG: trimethylamine methyltransferase family protein [Eubacterium sp.]